MQDSLFRYYIENFAQETKIKKFVLLPELIYMDATIRQFRADNQFIFINNLDFSTAGFIASDSNYTDLNNTIKLENNYQNYFPFHTGNIFYSLTAGKFLLPIIRLIQTK